jgi:GST-like protein
MSEVPFPSRWAPLKPDVLQLYSMATPNGQKISIALEEMALSYEPHLINIIKDDQHDPEYLVFSPNGKIPAIIDPNGPDGKRIALCESAAILIYLADKSGQLLPQNTFSRMEHIQWLMFQVGHVGPFFGQFGHFYKVMRDKLKDNYPLERYTKEAKKLLAVLDTRLENRKYIMNDYSIVDISMVPWVNCCAEFYDAWDYLDMGSYKNVEDWRKRVSERPAFVKGKKVCSI